MYKGIVNDLGFAIWCPLHSFNPAPGAWKAAEAGGGTERAQHKATAKGPEPLPGLGAQGSCGDTSVPGRPGSAQRGRPGSAGAAGAWQPVSLGRRAGKSALQQRDSRGASCSRGGGLFLGGRGTGDCPRAKVGAGMCSAPPPPSPPPMQRPPGSPPEGLSPGCLSGASKFSSDPPGGSVRPFSPGPVGVGSPNSRLLAD